MLPTLNETAIAETGAALADIALATIVVLAGGVMAAVAYQLSIRLEQRFEMQRGRGVHILENAIIAARLPLPIAILAVAAFIAFRDVLNLDNIYPWLGDSRLPQAITILVVTWWVANFLSRLVHSYGHNILPSPEEGEGASLADIAAISVKYLIWFVAILYLLNFLDISITPLIAGAGIAGIAVALAAQDVLSNLFGGVIILLDKPLRVGDKVRIDPYIGTVQRIGLRSTRIRTLDGLFATVPNSRITTNIVVNFTAGTARSSIQVPVTVDYGTPVRQSRAVLDEIARVAPAAAPPEMELRPGAVQIGELGRFGPVFILTFPARDETDPLAVKDVVYDLVADAVRSGRLAIGYGEYTRRPPAQEGSAAGGSQRLGGAPAGQRDEER
jgi:MscS family membrane protein